MASRTTLDNGLTLLTETMPALRSVALGVWLKKGARHEVEADNGISHFIEHLVFKGTRRRTARDIALVIDSIGGQVDAFTTHEYVCFFTRVLDEHLDVALELLGDVVQEADFAEEEMERERSVIFEEIKMVEDSPEELVYELLTASYWRDHPLGRPIQGTHRSVEQISKQQVLSYFRRAYCGPNMVIAAAGAVDPDRLTRQVTETFGALDGTGDGRTPFTPPVPVPGVVLRDKPELEQVHVCMALPGFAQDDERRYELYVLNTLLGGTMSSRLFQEIRENHGLAYSVGSSSQGFHDTGLFTIYGATSPDQVDELVRRICIELRRLKQEPVGADELRTAKENLKGSLMLGLESSSSRMSNLARQEIYFGRQIGLGEVLDGIESVSSGEVLDLAQHLFDCHTVGLGLLGQTSAFRLREEDVEF